jgi:undecaprenyl pyrophosphate phosphatase UppP
VLQLILWSTIYNTKLFINTGALHSVTLFFREVFNEVVVHAILQGLSCIRADDWQPMEIVRFSIEILVGCVLVGIIKTSFFCQVWNDFLPTWCKISRQEDRQTH